jgi:nucleotide-binding universal stress UspA family protein
MKAAPVRTRIAIQNILFATDFSPAANAAAAFAIQLGKSYGAKVYGVYVNPFENYAVAAPEAWAAVADTREERAKEYTERLNAQLRSVKHEVLIGEGNIWEELSDVVKAKQIDLMVIGTHGRTGLGRVVLGSVAEEILRQAPCPVLTVGPQVTLQAEKAADLREILYATDLAVEHPAAAPYAVSLAQETQAHLALLYVIDSRKTGGEFVPERLAETKVEKLHKLISKEAEMWCEPRYIVEEGIPGDKILEVAARQNSDLIVLGAQPASWLSTHLTAGTVHQVVSGAKCPVLTVRS